MSDAEIDHLRTENSALRLELADVRGRLTSALHACGVVAVEREKARIAEAAVESMDARLHRVTSAGLETLQHYGDALRLGLEECENLRARLNAQATGDVEGAW